MKKNKNISLFVLPFILFVTVNQPTWTAIIPEREFQVNQIMNGKLKDKNKEPHWKRRRLA